MSEKIWKKDEIKQGLEKSDQWINRAILAIYHRQTEDEKSDSDTRYQNGIGFNSADASLLSYYARYIQNKGSLTGHHKEKARKRIKKYSGQLAKIANGEL